jgi:hypothetical protein
VDPQNLVDTYSAFVYCDYPSKEAPDPQSMQDMLWASNYYRAFNHTVWTLFFAGKTFAPKCIIDGVNIQDWLQDHFTNAIAALAEHIQKAGGLYDECVLGWDSINEPSEGLIGVKDISVVPKEQPVQLGPVPSPFENMKLAMGNPVTVPNFTFTSMGPKKIGMITLDPKGKKLWLSEEADKERGGGKWGWTRGDSWDVGTCSESHHEKLAKISLGTARRLGRRVQDHPQARLLCPSPDRPKAQGRVRLRLLAAALDVVRVCRPDLARRGDPLYEHDRVQAPSRVARELPVWPRMLDCALLRRPHAHDQTLGMVQRRRAGYSARKVLVHHAGSPCR